MDNQETYEKYVLAKTNVQLEEATLEKVHIEKYEEISGNKFYNEVSFGKRLEYINDRNIAAYLRTVIKVRKQESDITALEIEIIYKGSFEGKEPESKEHLESWTDVQIVPQLLPYTRSIVASLTTHMGINPIFIPTMDVLESLKMNTEESSAGE